MDNQEKVQVIERVKNMSDNDANILDIFMVGFQSGVQIAKTEIEHLKSSEKFQGNV